MNNDLESHALPRPPAYLSALKPLPRFMPVYTAPAMERPTTEQMPSAPRNLPLQHAEVVVSHLTPARVANSDAWKWKRLDHLLIPAFALCMCSLPAMADTLFSNLGPPRFVYDGSRGSFVSSSGSVPGEYSEADLFTIAESGSLSVTEVDLGVTIFEYPDAFDAAIWTDDAGTPGEQVAGAFWTAPVPTEPYESCCALVSILGITGVILEGGQDYFLVLNPISNSDTSAVVWGWNTQLVTADTQFSQNGGITWNDNGVTTSGAFDILGSPTTTAAPEPGSLLLLGTGLIGLLGAIRSKFISEERK